MSDDYQHFVCTEIQVLTGLEAVRKRPGMYYDLSDPLLGSKLILTPLGQALAASVEAQVVLHSPTAATVAWKKAMPTEPIITGKTRAEDMISSLHAGVPEGHTSPFNLMGFELSVVNAACERFTIMVNDQHGEWGQTYTKGHAMTEFEVIGDHKGDDTVIEMELDTEWFKQAGAEVSIDERFVRSWCGDREIKVLGGKDEKSSQWGAGEGDQIGAGHRP